MKEPTFSEAEKAKMVREARTAVGPLDQNGFWREVLARLDQLDAAKRPKVEKREVQG